MIEPANKTRAKWANECLIVFECYNSDDPHTSIKDLISDLGHLLIEKGLNFEHAKGTMLAAIDIFEIEVEQNNV